MFTPVVAIFAFAAIIGLILIVKFKSKNDKRDKEAQHKAGSADIRPGRSET